MKLIVPNRDLLEKLTSVVKSVPKNGNFRFVADKNKLNIYSEHSAGWCKGVVPNINIIEEGEVAVPVSILPTLANASYPVDISLDNSLVVKHKTSGPRGIRLNLMTEPELIGINPVVPVWVDEIEELKRLTYLMADGNISKIWITKSSISVGNSFRFGVFKKELDIGDYVIDSSLFQKHFDIKEGLKLFINGNYIWFGNDGYYITISKMDSPIPDKLIELINSEPTYEFLCVISKDELIKTLANSRMLTKSDGPPAVSLAFEKNKIIFTPTGNAIGSGNPEVEARITGEYYTKINIMYLSQAVVACESDNLVISNLNMGNLSLLAIKDNEILHYIVPMV